MKALSLIAVCVVAAWLVGCSSPCHDEMRLIGPVFHSLVCDRNGSLSFEQFDGKTYAKCTCDHADGGAK